jgi:hypothetical protein
MESLRRPMVCPFKASGCGPVARRRKVVSTVSSGERVGRHIGGSLELRVSQPPSRQTTLTDSLSASGGRLAEAMTMLDAGQVVRLVIATSPLWITAGSVFDGA